MIDKYRAAARPALEPSLIREHYHDVPLGSVAWALVRVPTQPAQAVAVPGGMDLLGRWMAGSTIVASARYLRALHIRVEALMRSQSDAQQLLETIKTFFALMKGTEASITQGGTDVDVKAFFESLNAKQEGSRIFLTATVPPGFIRKALTPPPAAETAAPTPAPPQKGRKEKAR
jgi:hypothetical protein